MERPLEEIHQTLQKLVGLHRQLLDTVRIERQALLDANLKGIQEITLLKQALIEQISAIESERLKSTGELAVIWKKPARNLTLSQLIITVQGRDPKFAESLRSVFNTLNILVKHVSEQNADNRKLVDNFLGHVEQMKRNVLGEATPKSNTYTPQGKRASQAGGARLISKEA